MALFDGSLTARSPATQLPTRVPSASVNVADVISGSPGSNDHPEIHRAPTRTVASDPEAGTRIRAPLAPAPSAPPAPPAPLAPAPLAPSAPLAPLAPFAAAP